MGCMWDAGRVPTPPCPPGLHPPALFPRGSRRLSITQGELRVRNSRLLLPRARFCMWPCPRPFAQLSPESQFPFPMHPRAPQVPLTVDGSLLAEELDQLAEVVQVVGDVLPPPGPGVRGLQRQHLGDIEPLQEVAEPPIQAGVPRKLRAALGDAGPLQHGEGERGCERHRTSPTVSPPSRKPCVCSPTPTPRLSIPTCHRVLALPACSAPQPRATQSSSNRSMVGTGTRPAMGTAMVAPRPAWR